MPQLHADMASSQSDVDHGHNIHGVSSPRDDISEFSGGTPRNKLVNVLVADNAGGYTHRKRVAQKRNKALGALGDASTLGSTSYAKDPQCNRDDGDTTQVDVTVAKETLADKRKFTLPLTVIFLGECLLILAAFVVIIVVVQVRMNDSFKYMIQTNIRSALSYAVAEVSSPITLAEHVMEDSRTRYMSQKLISGVDPCSDDSVAFSASSNTLSDMAGLLRTYSSIILIFTVRWSTKNFNNVTGAPMLVECAATPNDIRTISNGDNRFSSRVVTAEDFANIDAVPYERKADEYLSLDTAASTLYVPILAWVPYIAYDPITNVTVLLLVGFAPLFINRTYANKSWEVYTPQTTDGARPSGATLKVLSSFGLSLSLASFNSIMHDITTAHPMAHASLYDIAGGTLLCSSLSSIPQYAPSNAMWPAGQTPSDSLNFAYNIVDVQTLVVNTPRIVFTNDHVISGTLLTTPFGIRFVIVRSTPREYYFSSIDSLRSLMIGIGVAAVVLTIGTAMMIAYSIHSGVHKVQENMEHAAVLRNERVIPSYSLITELNRLCVAFDQMNDKLIIARAYLPQHLLVSSTDDSAEEDEGEYGYVEEATSVTAANLSVSEASKSVALVTPKQVSPTQGPAAPIENLLSFDGITFNDNDNNTLPSVPTLTSKETKKESAQMSRLPANATGLSTKRVTILAINARNFHTDINVFAPNTAIEPTMDLTDIISNICNRERGVIDSFHGDHFVLSFNAARHNAEGPQKAARCAMDIIAAHEGLMEFSMGLSTGKACVGHLGTATLKRLSIIGEVYSRAMSNERMCRHNFSNVHTSTGAANGGASFSVVRSADGEVTEASNAIQCVADGIVAAEIQHTCLLQLLAVQPPTAIEIAHATQQQQSSTGINGLPLLPRSAQMHAEKLIYGVRGTVKKGGAKEGDEWLYEINHNYSPFLSQVNNAMMAFLTSTRSAALSNSPFEEFGATTDAQKQLMTEITTIRSAIARKAAGASSIMEADPAKLPQPGYLGNSGVGMKFETQAPMTKDEAVGHSAIQYATIIATSRQLPRTAAGLVGATQF